MVPSYQIGRFKHSGDAVPAGIRIASRTSLRGVEEGMLSFEQ